MRAEVFCTSGRAVTSGQRRSRKCISDGRSDDAVQQVSCELVSPSLARQIIPALDELLERVKGIEPSS
jgi:hypothetical protein